MEARIISSSGNRVLVISPIGSFWANWCSSFKSACKNYSLELDSPDVLVPSSIQPSQKRIPSITSNDTGIVLSGVIEQIEDSVLFLRLQSDLLMLEIADSCEFSPYLNHYVNVFLSSIDVYAIDP